MCMLRFDASRRKNDLMYPLSHILFKVGGFHAHSVGRLPFGELPPLSEHITKEMLLLSVRVRLRKVKHLKEFSALLVNQVSEEPKLNLVLPLRFGKM